MAAMTVCTPVRPPRDDSPTRAREPIELKSTPGGKMMMRGRRTRPSRSRRDDARAAFATSRSTPTISATCPLARPTIADRRDGRCSRASSSQSSRGRSFPVRSRSALSPRALSPVSLVHQAMLTSKVSTGIKAQKKAVRASKATGAVAFLDNKKAAAVAPRRPARRHPVSPPRLTSPPTSSPSPRLTRSSTTRSAPPPPPPTSSAPAPSPTASASSPRTCSAARSPPPPATSPSSPPTRTSSARAPATARCARPRLPALFPVFGM